LWNLTLRKVIFFAVKVAKFFLHRPKGFKYPYRISCVVESKTEIAAEASPLPSCRKPGNAIPV